VLANSGDKLTGSAENSTWNIAGPGTGSVGSVAFDSEDLQGPQLPEAPRKFKLVYQRPGESNQSACNMNRSIESSDPENLADRIQDDS